MDHWLFVNGPGFGTCHSWLGLPLSWALSAILLFQATQLCGNWVILCCCTFFPCQDNEWQVYRRCSTIYLRDRFSFLRTYQMFVPFAAVLPPDDGRLLHVLSGNTWGRGPILMIFGLAHHIIILVSFSCHRGTDKKHLYTCYTTSCRNVVFCSQHYIVWQPSWTHSAASSSGVKNARSFTVLFAHACALYTYDNYL